VDSFTGSGTVVEDVPSVTKPELLLFSANTETSLKEQIRQHQEYVSATSTMVSDIAYTRALHREHLPLRAFGIVDNGGFIETAGGVKAAQKTPAVTMVFGGQGAQWPEMGKELVLTNHRFREDILKMDQVLRRLRFQPEWSLMGTYHYDH
jgi:acyl transferase domain-containing protein